MKLIKMLQILNESKIDNNEWKYIDPSVERLEVKYNHKNPNENWDVKLNDLFGSDVLKNSGIDRRLGKHSGKTIDRNGEFNFSFIVDGTKYHFKSHNDSFILSRKPKRK